MFTKQVITVICVSYLGVAWCLVMPSLVCFRLSDVICRYVSCRAVSILCMTAMLTYFVIEYIHFDVWNAHQFMTAKGCDEDIYIFEPDENHASPLQDPALAHKCYKYSTYDRLSQGFAAEHNGSPPEFFTKCGPKTARLISKNKSHQTAQTTEIHTTFQVPNIVHYVALGRWRFTFLCYLSVKSVHLHIRPDHIIFHGDRLPYGYWWNRTMDEIPNIYHVVQGFPRRIQGRKIPWLEHASDLVRLQAIYCKFEIDVVTTKSSFVR